MSKIVQRLKHIGSEEGPRFGRSRSVEKGYSNDFSRDENQLNKLMRLIEKESNTIDDLSEKLANERSESNKARLHRLINMHNQSFSNLSQSYRAQTDILNKKYNLMRGSRGKRLTQRSSSGSSSSSSSSSSDSDKEEHRGFLRKFHLGERHKSDEKTRREERQRQSEQERASKEEKKAKTADLMKKVVPNKVDLGFYLNIKH